MARNAAISKSTSYHRVSEDRFVLVNAVRLLVSPAIRETRTTTTSPVTRHGQLLLTLELFSHKPTSLSPLRIWPWWCVHKERVSTSARTCTGQRLRKERTDAVGGAARTPGP